MLAKALGSFTFQDRKVEFSLNNSEVISDALIDEYGARIIRFDLEALTVEFENNTFLYFLRRRDIIHFVHGDCKDFIKLTDKVNKGLEGEVLEVQSLIANESVSRQLGTSELHIASTPDPKKDHVRLHHSFFQPISDFRAAYQDAELYFEPFEDPGGDFYWTKDFQYKNLIVLGDCTGHGIQGAMISISILTLLKQHFRLPPNAIGSSLAELYDKIEELKNDEGSGAYDAEMGVVMLDKRKGELTFAGSGIDLIHKSEDICTRYRTKRQVLKKNSAEQFQISIKQGDQLFISSDGVIDQFDAQDNKRLGTAGFLKLIKQLPVCGTLDAFNKSFNEFKGNTEQLDDQSMLIITI